MHGGTHHEPSVFTHFLPGMLSGFVLGGVAGTLIITNIATSSLQLFWQSVHEDNSKTVVSCADVSGVHVTSHVSDTGSTLTSLAVGDGEEMLLTVPAAQVRYVPSTGTAEAYLTVVADVSQQQAFPATSLYRLDYCTKTITHVLGDGENPVEILALSNTGDWVAYMGSSGLLLMQTDDHQVIGPSLFASLRPEEILFAPSGESLALRYATGERVVWNVGLHGYVVSEEQGTSAAQLPAWGVQTAQEYFANIQ